MRTLKVIACIFFLQASSSLFAQYGAKDVVASKEAIWFGFDFSNFKMVGEPRVPGYKDPQSLVKFSFDDWNRIPLAEPGKYDIKGTFEKKELTNDISAVISINEKFDPKNLMDNTNTHTISKDQIPAMIAKYEGLSLVNEGIGIVFIVEKFDNIQEIASYYAVIFDIKTKNVLFCEKVLGTPAGANMKNYWSGAFRQGLESAKEAYKTWKKQLKTK